MPTSLQLASKSLIIAAISSRAYVKAAVEAGFEVVAIDAFADVDTAKLAQKTFQVALKDGQFELQSILDVLRDYSCAGFCYGAGFEAAPNVLVEISKRIPVVGNSVETVKNCKNPQYFFALCDALNMPYPETAFERPVNTEGWLSKSIGASGGVHIRPASQQSLPNIYFQKVQHGTPVSCLFLADAKSAQTIGYNEQWCSPTDDYPYRYGGAVCYADISESCKKVIESFIHAITPKLGLRGINSCDFIVQDDQVFALEINPRLSATLDLYRAKAGNLFAAHVNASLGHLQKLPKLDDAAKAHQVIYAEQKTHIGNKMEWPGWVCDIPQPNTVIEAGMPICTVMAEAASAAEARQIVIKRTIDCTVRLC